VSGAGRDAVARMWRDASLRSASLPCEPSAFPVWHTNTAAGFSAAAFAMLRRASGLSSVKMRGGA